MRDQQICKVPLLVLAFDMLEVQRAASLSHDCFLFFLLQQIAV